MKKGTTKQITVTVLAVVIGTALGKLGVEHLMSSNTLDKTMMNAASELNKTYPIMVDRDTRLDNAVVLPDNAFQYNYTLVSWSYDEIDVEQLRSDMASVILNIIKTNDELKTFRDNKVTMNYSYNDKNGIFFFTRVQT